MDWKKAAESDLRTLEARRSALRNMKDRIASLKVSCDGLRSAFSDSTPVQGGGNKTEDKMLNNLAEVERLKYSYAATKKLVEITERGLEGLSEDEKTVLQYFYITPISKAVDDLCERLGYEKSQIYRIKDRALYKFTIAEYGLYDY